MTLGGVCFWPKAEILSCTARVCFGPSLYVAPPHDFGRKRDMAEMTGCGA